MHSLHHLTHALATTLAERATARSLNRLGDRGLADIGLTRGDVRPAARIAARLGSSAVPLADLQRRLAQAGEAAPAAAAPARDGLPRLSRRDVARFVKEGRRRRDAELARLGRSTGRLVAGLGRALAEPVVALADAAGLTARLELARVRRREYARVRAELATYSDRELMADLRIAASQILDIAAEGAKRGVEDFVRANPAYRQAWWRSRARRAAAERLGYAGG